VEMQRQRAQQLRVLYLRIVDKRRHGWNCGRCRPRGGPVRE
jgi:hypothetical protein